MSAFGPGTDPSYRSQTAAQELGIYGRLRKVARCGPVLMFRRLLVLWRDRYDAVTIADRVKVMRVIGSLPRLCTLVTPEWRLCMEKLNRLSS